MCRDKVKIHCPYGKGALIEGRIEHHSMREGKTTTWVKLVVDDVLSDGRMVLRSEDLSFEFRPTIVPYKEGWFRPRSN